MRETAERWMNFRSGSLLIALATCGSAWGQSQMEVRGSYTLNSTLTRQGIVYPSSSEVTFSCSGTPTCTGTYVSRETNGFCNQPFTISNSFRITGLSLVQPGPIQGAMTFTNFDYSFSAPDDRNCNFNQFLGDRTRQFTG